MAPNPPQVNRNRDVLVLPGSQQSYSLSSLLPLSSSLPFCLSLDIELSTQQAFSRHLQSDEKRQDMPGRLVCFLLNNRIPPIRFQCLPGIFQNMVVFIGICRLENSWGFVFNLFIFFTISYIYDAL